MFALLDGGKPGHLITPDAGTHEFTKVYYLADKGFNLGGGFNDRLGGQFVRSVDFDVLRGMLIETTDYTLHVPASSMKACWKRS